MMWELAGLVLAAAEAAGPGQKELSWMGGRWESQAAQGGTEEYRTGDRSGLMLGLNRSGKGAKAAAFEYMRLQRDGRGRVGLWAR